MSAIQIPKGRWAANRKTKYNHYFFEDDKIPLCNQYVPKIPNNSEKNEKPKCFRCKDRLDFIRKHGPKKYMQLIHDTQKNFSDRHRLRHPVSLGNVVVHSKDIAGEWVTKTCKKCRKKCGYFDGGNRSHVNDTCPRKNCGGQIG